MAARRRGVGTLAVRGVLIAGVCLGMVGAQARADAKAAAREVLNATGFRGGLIVHVGCGDGKLTAALRAGDHTLVHGLSIRTRILKGSVWTGDSHAANIEKARETIRQLGLYGKVSVEHWTGQRLPYADNLVNLLVSEDLGKIPMDEVKRVLAPGGVAYIKTGGNWTKTVKPRPQEIDEWTHFLHDASNNAVAHDALVGPPRYMQWVAKPLWLRSHETESGVSALVSAGGRVFYILDEGLIGIVDERLPCTWSLVARDAFNGVLLWKRPMPQWGWRAWKREALEGKDLTQIRGRRAGFPAQMSRRLVAEGDRVFVTLGYRAPLTILDAATGQVVRTCKGTEGADEILYSQGTVVLCVRSPAAQQAGRRGSTTTERLMAIKADTGQVLWDKAAKRIRPLSLAIRGGRLFVRESDAILCLNLKTGETLWSTPKKGARGGTFVAYQGVLLISDPATLQAFSAETGKPLWTNKTPVAGGAAAKDLFVADGLVWRGLSGVGLDPLTGEQKKKVVAKNLRSVGHHHRCYRGKATDRYLMSAKEGIEFLDIQSNRHSRNNWLRGACKYGIMPCNGLLYVPPDQCFCEPGVKLLGFCALAAQKKAASTNPAGASPGRLQVGPVYTQIRNLKPVLSAAEGSEIRHPGDWPTYRHDATRSGATASAVPTSVERLWQAELGGKITPAVVAGGTLFIASVDTHTVHALDARNGKPLWTYTAGGRVDSPPTVHNGLVLFGSADGWVYCLRAADGKLAWRFRAAPDERRVGAFGQIESAWPVHGSVLVQNNVAYVTAGRSSFLDGGIYVHGLDPATGKMLSTARLDGPHPDFDEGPGRCFYVAGARSEVLVGDGTSVFMRQVQFDGKLVRQKTPYITHLGDRKVGLHLFSTAGFLDDSWYNRTYWMYAARWPGFYHANQAPKSGQMIVYDDTTTYAVKVFYRRNVHSPMFFPGKEGYLLFADDNSNEPALVDKSGNPKPIEWLPQSEFRASRGRMKLNARAVDYDKGVGFTRTRPPQWTAWVPVRIRAMVAAAGTLFVAGPPDVFDPNDPLAAFQGRKGGLLWAVAAADGKKLAEYHLDSPPVLDGMIAAGGRLFISTRDGRVLCMGKGR